MSPLVFRITGDPASFKAAMGEVSSSLDATGRKAALVSDVFGRMGTAMTLGITVPAIAAGAAVIRAASNMEALKKGLDSVATAADTTEDQLKRLKEVAKLPGLGFSEAIQGSVRLQSAGFSANLAERSLKAFGNALATVGRGKADLDGVSLALTQIASKGKISAEEINQLAERVPQIRKAMQAAFGTADTEIIQKAGIGATEFVTKVVVELEKLKSVTGGTKNSLENLGDTFNALAVRIGEKFLPIVNATIPKLEKLAIGVADLADGFTNLPEPIQNTALALGALLIAAGPVTGAVGKIIGAIGSIKGVAGVAGVALGSLFGAAVIASIAQTMTDLDKLAARYKDLAEDIERRKKGLQDTIKGQENIGIGGVRTKETFAVPDLIGVKDNAAAKLGIDLRAISQELGILGDKAAKVTTPAVKDLTKAVAGATNAIKVTSVAMREANGVLSKTSLVYVETLERVKSAVGKVKDVMYEYITAGTLLGKQMELATGFITNFIVADGALSAVLVSDSAHFGELARRSDDYAASLRKLIQEQEKLVANDNLGSLPGPPSAFPKLPTTWSTEDSMRSIGLESTAQKQKEIAAIEKELATIKQLNLEGKASGNDVIAVQEKLRKAIEETTGSASKSSRAQSRGLQQVSTILTDLSRGIANAGIGLLFDKPKVDVAKYRDEIAGLEADIAKLTAAQGEMSEETARLKDEESKLIAAQVKGHNVTAQLAVVRAKILESEKKGSEALTEAQKKLADANKRMGEELHKASFGFRAMEAGKAIIEDLAKSIVRTLIEGALTQLAKKLFDVGGIMSQVFGGASGPGGTIFSAASGGGASAAGGASGAGGIAGSVASAGVSAAIGVVTGVVSAISGVIGNFQFAHMNTALGRIEESTRYLKIYTGEQSQSLLWCAQKSTELLGYITTSTDAIGRLNSEMLANLQIIAGGSGADPAVAAEGGINVSMEGAYLISDYQMGDFADRLIRLLKSRGVQFA